MRKLLIVVDYQNDFVDGSLGFEKAKKLEEGICEKIKAFENVVFTFDTHEENYLATREGRDLPVPHCIVNTPGWNLYGNVQKLSVGREMFFKNTFGSKNLFDWLSCNPFDEITLVGLVSNICVLSNAILAKTAQPQAEIVVDASLTASADEALHEKALDVLEGLFIRVDNR